MDTLIKQILVSFILIVQCFYAHAEYAKGSHVNIVTFSHDGKYIVTGGSDGVVKVWDVVAKNMVRSFQGLTYSTTYQIGGVAISPDDKFIAISSGSKVLIYTFPEGKEITSFKNKDYSDVTSLAYTPDGIALMIGSKKARVEVWDINKASVIKKHQTKETPYPTRFAVSPDKNSLLIGNQGVEFWDIPRNKRTFRLDIDDDKYIIANSVAFSPDSKFFAVGYEGGATLYTSETRAIVKKWSADTKALLFSADGKYLFQASSDFVLVNDITSGTEPSKIKGHSAAVISMALSPEGKFLATGSEDGTAKVWELATGKMVGTFTHSGTAFSVKDPVIKKSPSSELTTNYFSKNCLAKSGNTIYAGTNSGVYLSTDNGTNWKAANTGLTDSIRSIVVSGSNIFATSANGVFLSNNGTKWTAVNNGLPLIKSLKSYWNSNCVKPYSFVSSMAVNGATIFVGTPEGVFFSNDNGTSWTASNNGLSNTEIYSLGVCGNTIFAGTGQGIFVSTDKASNWIATDFNKLVYLFYSSDNKVYASTNEGVFFADINEAVWRKLDNLTVEYTKANSVAISEAGAFVGTSVGLFKTTNKWGPWTEVQNGFPKGTVVQSVAVSGKNVLASTVNGMYISTNNGLLWTKNKNGLPENYQNGKLITKGATVFLLLNGDLYFSGNRGEHWTKVEIQQEPTEFQLAIDGPNMVMGTENEGVLISVDNGAHWRGINNGLPKSDNGYACIRSVTISGNTILAVIRRAGWGSLKDGIFLTTNTGKTWTNMETGLPDGVFTDIAIEGADLYVKVATYGYNKHNFFGATVGGKSWTIINEEDLPKALPVSDNTGPKFFGSDKYSSATSGANVLMTTSYGVFLSTDSGTSYIRFNEGLEPFDAFNFFKYSAGILKAKMSISRSWDYTGGGAKQAEERKVSIITCTKCHGKGTVYVGDKVTNRPAGAGYNKETTVYGGNVTCDLCSGTGSIEVKK